MKKNRIIAICNLFAGIGAILFFAAIIVPNISDALKQDSQTALWYIIWTVVDVIAICSNLFFVWRLGISKKEVDKLLLTLSLVAYHVIGWILLTFLVAFHLPIYYLVTIVSIFLLATWKLSFDHSKILTLCLSVMTILIVGVMSINEFEEDYCWKKGAQAETIARERGESLIVPVTPETKDFTGTDTIGLGWSVHMACHKNFNVIDAVKDSYFGIKN